jgi:hypothetical protein
VVVAKAEVVVAKAEVAVAKAEVVDAKAEAVDAKAEVAIAKAEVAVAKAEVAVAKVEVAVAKAEAVVAKAEAVVAKAEVAIAKTEVVVAKTEVVVAKAEVVVGPIARRLQGIHRIDPAQAWKTGESLIGADQCGAVLDGECGEPDIVDVVATEVEGGDEIGEYPGMAGAGSETAGARIAPQIVSPKSKGFGHRHQLQLRQRGNPQQRGFHQLAQTDPVACSGGARQPSAAGIMLGGILAQGMDQNICIGEE